MASKKTQEFVVEQVDNGFVVTRKMMQPELYDRANSPVFRFIAETPDDVASIVHDFIQEVN